MHIADVCWHGPGLAAARCCSAYIDELDELP